MLKTRDLVGISVFWLALSMLSDGISALVLPSTLMGLVAESRQATALGLISFAGLLAAMLVQPPAGAWSDRLRPRFGRRGALAAGLLLTMLALGVIGMGAGLWWVAGGYVLALAASSVAQAAQQGFLPDLVPPAQRGRASGWKMFMDLAGAMLGFVLLGQVIENGGARLGLVVIAVALLVTFVLTVLLVREPRVTQPVTPASHAGLAAVYRLDLRLHRAFVRLVLARFLFLTGTYAVGRFLLFFVAERLGLDAGSAASQAGGLLAALSLMTVAFALPAGWAADRLGRGPVMVFGALASAAGTLLLAAAYSSAIILAGGALMAVGSAAFSSASWALTADLVPQGQAGRFFGLANIGTAGAAAAAGLFGPLIDAANALRTGSGYSTLMVAASLVTLASLLVLRGLRRVVAVPVADTEMRG